jgi:diacylglycerol kinase (ATP)
MASSLVDIETSPEAILEDEELIQAVEELIEKAAVSVYQEVYNSIMDDIVHPTLNWFLVHFPIILEYQAEGSSRMWLDLQRLLFSFMLFVLAFVFLAPTSSWFSTRTVSGAGFGTLNGTAVAGTFNVEDKGGTAQPWFRSFFTFWKRQSSIQQQQQQRSRSNSEGSGRTDHDDENSSFTEYNSTSEVTESEEERFARYYYECIVHSNYRKLVLPPTCCRVVEANPQRHHRKSVVEVATAAGDVATAGPVGGVTAATAATAVGPSPQRRRAANERATSVEPTEESSSRHSHSNRQEEDNPAKRLRTYFLHFLHLVRSFFTYDYASVGYTMILWMQGIRQYRTRRADSVGVKDGEQHEQASDNQQDNQHQQQQQQHENETNDDDDCTLEDDFRSVDNASLTSVAATATTTNETIASAPADVVSLPSPTPTTNTSAEQHQEQQQQHILKIPLFPPRNSTSSGRNSKTLLSSLSTPILTTTTPMQSTARTRISVTGITSDEATVYHEVLQQQQQQQHEVIETETRTDNNLAEGDLLLSSSSLAWLSSSSLSKQSLQQQSSLQSLDSLEEKEKKDSAGASVPKPSHIENDDENDLPPPPPRHYHIVDSTQKQQTASTAATAATANEASASVSTILAPTVVRPSDTTTVAGPPPSPLENGDESVSYYFESANSEESLKQLSVQVPVPDKHGYILGDEFLPDYDSKGQRSNNYYTPLLVFVNSRAGPQQGHLLITQLRRLLNPIQIWDLANGSPGPILESFCVLSRLRILVCGGDGTISWIISALEALNLKADQAAQAIGGLQYQRQPQQRQQQQRKKWPPIAILPLGTGNDLSRIHGWGGGYNNESLLTILEQVSEAYISLLDRWEMVIEEKSTSSSKGSGNNKQITKKHKTETKSFFNYLGVGADAQAALQVHFLRQTRPQWFFSRLVNKAWYGVFGAEDIIKASSVHVRKEIILYADGVQVPLPPDSQGIILLNIDSYAGGVPLWAHGTNPPSTSSSDTSSHPGSPFRRSFSMQDIGGRRRSNQQQQRDHRQHQSQHQHFADVPSSNPHHTYHHHHRRRWDLRTQDSMERVDSMDDLQTLVLSDEERYARVTACDHPSSCQDGLLEVVSIRGAFHLGQIKVGLSNAQRLCQCREAKIVIKSKVAVQIDGEPWRQDKCVLHVRRKKDYPAVSMLHRSPDESGGVETEMSKLLDWAEERRLIDSQVHSILMKEFSRRIECKTRQRRVRSQESSTNVLHNLKRAIGSTASMSNMTGGGGMGMPSQSIATTNHHHSWQSEGIAF